MRTAAMTTMPAATPMLLVSTISTGKPSICSDTIAAVAYVAERPDEMVTNTARS